MLAEFHFLRPWWLLGLLALFVLPKIKPGAIQKDSPWYRIADYSLLKNLLFDSGQGKERKFLRTALAFCWILTVLALAGPAWDKKEFKTVADRSNFVIVSEISSNMLAGDLKPSRLDHMKFKLYDLLERTRGNNVAMIVYDEFPYMLSPFTQDTNIIRNFVSVFDVRMMPSPGANLGRALSKTLEMLDGYGKSNIVLFATGDRYNASLVFDLAKEIRTRGHILSVIAVGTEEPVPIPAGNGGFMKDERGGTLMVRTDFDFLKTVAEMGGGVFRRITADDSDIDAILALAPSGTETEISEEKGIQWRDMGAYIPIILLPFALFLFKRGFLIALLILISSPSYAFTWKDLWQNHDQQGIELLTENPKAAAEKFKDPSYKGAAEYKSGQYDKALQNFSKTDDLYNAGNAMAHLGMIDKAIEAYEEVLKKNPDHEDAKFNLEYLKNQEEKQRQNQQQQQQPHQEQNQDGQQGQDQQNQQQQQQQQNQGQGQQQQRPQQGQNQQQQNPQDEGKQPGWQIGQDESGKEQQDALIQKPSSQNQQWMENIEPDPYGLLRAKLKLMYDKEYRK